MNKAQLGILAHQENRANEGLLAKSVPPDHEDRQVMMGNPDLRDAKALLDLKDLEVHEAQLVSQEIQDPWGDLAHRVRSRLPMHRNPVSGGGEELSLPVQSKHWKS